MNSNNKSNNSNKSNMANVQNLMASLTAVFQSTIDQFAERLVVVSDGAITRDSVFSAWNSVSDMKLANSSAPLAALALATVLKKKPRVAASGRGIPTGVRCEYAFKKGSRKNEQCGANVPKEGRTMCNRHQKHDPAIGTTAIEVAAPVEIEEKKEVVVAPTKKSSLNTRLIRDKKTNRYVHPMSGLVVDKTSKEVTGVQDPNGDLRPLTTDDMKNAEKYNFNVAADAVPDDYKEQEEDEDEEEVEEESLEVDELEEEEEDEDDEMLVEEEEEDDELDD
jgi:hypothetical protein